MSITSTLYVGLDVSLDTNQVCVMNFNQDVFFNRSFKNSRKDSKVLIDKLIDVLHTHHFSKIMVCMESTSLYFFHIANELSIDKQLQNFDCLVYCVNPKMVANYK